MIDYRHRDRHQSVDFSYRRLGTVSDWAPRAFRGAKLSMEGSASETPAARSIRLRETCMGLLVSKEFALNDFVNE